MADSTLKQLNIRKPRRLAGDLWFARGEAYFQKGRVSELSEHRGKLAARVKGTRNYAVKLWNLPKRSPMFPSESSMC
ncbi:MAG: SWIM zinc finger family protein [Pyrinomonadaceae bacterium]